jgi:hypothetical protein
MIALAKDALHRSGMIFATAPVRTKKRGMKAENHCLRRFARNESRIIRPPVF